jgi:pyruvate/2-oxoglutarate dehydrogenase complex dihydrolipoamide dehydrogenase (E3) component
VPNTDELALHTVGVELDERGYIRTDEHFHTSASGIYAVGDVNGRGAFTHTAYQDGEILGDHLAGGGRSVAGRVPTYALFTDPPLGRVGITREQAEREQLDVEVIDYPMARVTRAVLDAETDGLVRLVVDRSTRRLRGAAWLGPNGDELVQALSLLMHVDAPVDVVRDWLPIHPTLAEFLPTIVAGSGH